MKKLINTADRYVDDMLNGLVAAHPELTRTGPGGRVIRRTQKSASGKVGIVSGGGSGHLPLFTGYVGAGLLDTCAIGDVFAGPNLESCVAAIEEADHGRGVLRLYGNYGGDRMNFDLAGDTLGWPESRLSTVLATDDIASAPPTESDKRRGVAGLVFAYKVAGAAADEGADLPTVSRVAQHTVDNTFTLGCALSPCQVPGSASPTFKLDEDEMEMGMGIHGEPGIWRDKLRSADDVSDELLERLLDETPGKASDRVAVLLNSLGATPLEELYILYQRITNRAGKFGLRIAYTLIGHYATSMEMAGVSLSVLHLDDEIEALLTKPARCSFWRNLK
jgi:dihydroxyacetone kinase-like protein